uniref:hypothetical protein n=1 Tax=Carnobacterium maltaromaticum TaxID=2751 RepID=UPI00344EAE52
MMHIKAYEDGKIGLSELQDHLAGIGESESLLIGSNRMCFYLQLQSEGVTFDYSQSVFADWGNSMSF